MPEKDNLDLIVCNASHAIICPNKLDKVPVGEFVVEEKSEVDHSKFGLFNVTSPNLNTYYPDLKLEDIKPEEGDFIYPVFRLLSEVVVHKMTNPIDFRQNDILKNSMGLLVGQTIYTEHEELIGNHIGTIIEVFWQEAYKTNGVKVPAGVNAVLKIDAKSNPKIARGILQEPPAVHSVSVSVLYQWVKSHNLDDNEFYSKLGQFNEKGELIRKIVSDIILYSELSLVPHGADPFAQLLKDNKITNPLWAKKFYSLGGDKFSYMDFKNIPKGELEVEISKFNINKNPIKNFKSMPILEKLAKKMGYEGEVTEDNAEQLVAHLDKLMSDNLENETNYSKEIKDLKSQIAKLQTTNDELSATNTQLAADKDFIEVGKSHLTTVREKAVNTYSIIKGEKKDEKIIELINNSNLETVQSLLKDYEEEFNKLSPLKCDDCNSLNVSRASAANLEEGDDDGGDDNKPFYKSNLEVHQNRRKHRFTTKRLHGE